MSRSIDQKRGDSALVGCANSAARLLPHHSKSCGPTDTENDISDMAVGTSSDSKSAIRLG